MSKQKAQTQQELEQQRLDTWLWASRFFKNRKIAHDAATSGHVWINGNKSKPAKTIKIGDRLKIRRHYEQFEIEVLGLSSTRLSAPAAQKLYHETEQSRKLREQKRELNKLNALSAPYSQTRPNKRERRQLMKLKSKT